MREIRVPRDSVNDDYVTIVAWRYRSGERVRAREVVASIETSKAVIDVEATADGSLEVLHEAGSEVAIGELIGRVLAAPESTAVAHHSSNGAAATTPTTPGAGDSSAAAAISHKAKALIEQYGLDPAVFAGRGLVRENDVIRYLEARAASSPSPAPNVEAGAPAAAAAPAGRETSYASKGLWGDATRSAGDRGRGVFWLAWNYFWRNWLLGNLVSVAPRGVNLWLHKLRGVKLGDDCFVDPTAILETAYPEMITLGNDVRVTARCVVMCHIKAPHRLRETGIVPAVLKPVTLSDHCFIGVNSVVMPGVTVGEGAVVTSGSVVLGDVAPYTMVGGNPAKLIKTFPRPTDGAPGSHAAS